MVFSSRDNMPGVHKRFKNPATDVESEQEKDLLKDKKVYATDIEGVNRKRGDKHLDLDQTISSFKKDRRPFSPKFKQVRQEEPSPFKPVMPRIKSRGSKRGGFGKANEGNNKMA